METKTAKTWGPPGTGKTTYLLRQISKDCQKYFPNKIGAVSLTNAAVTEIKSRIAATLDINPADARNVRTIHSHCYNILCMNKNQVADTAKHFAEFSETYPQLAIKVPDVTGQTEYNQIQNRNQEAYNTMQICRNRMIPKEKWPDPHSVTIYNAWSDYMRENSLTDFTGMMENALYSPVTPDIDVLYIDECQDTSVLAMELIKKWSMSTEKTVYIGDTDQALFRFAGAVPESFGNINADFSNMLKHSYRVPEKVYDFAQKIIRQISDRTETGYMPYNKETHDKIADSGGNPKPYYTGNVIKANNPDLTLPGTHMILSRCGKFLQKHIIKLRENNTIFHNPYRPKDNAWNPTSSIAWHAAGIYHRVRQYHDITVRELKDLVKICVAKKCFSKTGIKKQISEMPNDKDMISFFDLMGMGFTEEFTDGTIPPDQCLNIKTKTADMIFSILKSYPQKLFETPKIIPGTIHSVKGGEADHVWIDCEMSYPILKALNVGENKKQVWDDECRCFYVAATRARQTVGIMNYSNNPVIRNII